MASRASTDRCHNCDREVESERIEHGDYRLRVCPSCGLGVGVDVERASAHPKRTTLGNEESPPLFPGAPHPSIPPASGLPPMGSVAELPAGFTQPPLELSSTLAEPTGPGNHRAKARDRRSKPMRSIYVVDSNEPLCTAMRTRLTGAGFAREVITCDNGEALVELLTRSLVAGRKTDLLILDIRLPLLDGRDAAFVVRAVESALGMRKTPILFFSPVICDVPFKAMLEQLGNAKYVRKSEGKTVDQLSDRIAQVVGKLVGARGS